MFILRKIIVWQYLAKSDFHKSQNDSTPFMSAIFTGCLPFAFLTLALHVIMFYEFDAKFVIDTFYLVAVSTITLILYKIICLHDSGFMLEQEKFNAHDKSRLYPLVWSIDIVCFILMAAVFYVYQS